MSGVYDSRQDDFSFFFIVCVSVCEIRGNRLSSEVFIFFSEFDLKTNIEHSDRTRFEFTKRRLIGVGLVRKL